MAFLSFLKKCSFLKSIEVGQPIRCIHTGHVTSNQLSVDIFPAVIFRCKYCVTAINLFHLFRFP